mgnify:CR=1 FL=1
MDRNETSRLIEALKKGIVIGKGGEISKKIISDCGDRNYFRVTVAIINCVQTP